MTYQQQDHQHFEIRDLRDAINEYLFKNDMATPYHENEETCDCDWEVR